MTRRSWAGGFTLVEVLVALVIVALGAAAVMSSMNSAVSTTTRLRDRSFAEWVAINRITESRLSVSFPALGRSEGVVRMAESDWQWRQDIRKTSIEGVVQIIVEVRRLGSTDDWLTVSGARGQNVIVTGDGESLWDTAERASP